MTRLRKTGSPLILALLAGWAQIACSPREQTTDDTAPAPIDTAPAPGPSIDTAFVPDTIADTAAAPGTIDTTVAPDTAVATPPIIPSQSSTPRDTPPSTAPEPSAAEQPSGTQGGQQQGGQVSEAEYEGWRQYSVNCARCHGQDALPNPVAANLLVSVGPGGPVRSAEQFAQVVSEGRPDRGMPAFKSIMTPGQIQAVYAYVKGRADKRIPPGRPARPTG
jgi:mono/diheme cytochrome c family protein